MNAVLELKNIRFIKLQLDILRRRYDDIVYVKAFKFSNISKNMSIENGQENKMLADTEIIMQLRQQMRDYSYRIKNVEKKVNSLDNELYKTILQMFYFEGKKLEQISVDLNFTYRYIQFCKKEGERQIARK